MCDFKWTSLIVYGHSSGSMRLYGNAQMLTFSIYNVYHCHYPIWVASDLSFGHLCQKPAWTSHMHCCMYCTHQYTIQIGCYTHVNHDSSLCWRAKILLTIPIHKEHPRRMWMPFFLQVFGYKLKYTDKFKFLSEMLAITKDFRVHPEWDWMCEQNLEKLTLTLTLTNCQYLRARESFWSELPNLTWQYLMHPYKRMWTAYYSKVSYYTWEYLFSAFQM